MLNINTNIDVKQSTIKGTKLMNRINKLSISDVSVCELLFGKQNSVKGKTKKFLYFPNKDGSIRWLIPAENKTPGFLTFYNRSGLKANIIYKAISMLYKLNLQKFVLKPIELSINEESNFIKFLKENQIETYSIFTGTVGINRTVLVEYLDQDKNHSILKLPTTLQARVLMNNELKWLQKMQKLNNKKFDTPNVELNPVVNGIVQNVVGENGLRSAEFTKVHSQVLSEFYETKNSKKILSESFFWNKIIKRIDDLETEEIKAEMLTTFELLKLLISQQNIETEICFGFTHGDFTPWNMYYKKDQLFVYDFEMANETSPILYDLFHFIMQAGILQKNQNFKQIQNTITDALNLSDTKKIIDEQKIIWKDYFNLYLIDVVSYYLTVYNKQDKLHEQVSWLLNTWNTALEGELLYYNNGQSFRNSFIQKFFFDIANTPYALLKFTERDINKISDHSDIDMVIEKEKAITIIKQIKANSYVEKVKLQNFSFMSIIDIYFKDGSFLEIDFIYDIKRKDQLILKGKDVLTNANKLESGINVASIYHDFVYTTCFYQLNGAAVPKHYISFFKKQKVRLLDLFNEAFETKVTNLNEFGSKNSLLKQQLRKKLKSNDNNKSINAAKNKINYLIDSAKKIFSSNGVVISFSGVDGAGKSTVIDLIKNELEQKYRKQIVVLRHRPSLLPIISSFKYGKEKAEKIATETLPHAGNNQSKLSSIIRFTYYFLDYIIGQWYIKVKYLWKGYVVLYDRYYFDFIEDAKRSNIVVNKSIAKWLYRFVFKPDLNIFLYASPDVILKRKQEVTAEKIVSMTTNYKNLFQKFNSKNKKSKYICIENIELDKTKEQVLNAYKKAI